MKKFFSISLVLMMICVFSFGETMQVFGAQSINQSKNQSTKSINSIKGTIEDREEPDRINEKYEDCMPNAAIVMFRATDETITKGQAKRALSSGTGGVSDITVKDLWTFKRPAELKSDSSGKKKFVRDGESGEYVRVALVRSKSMSAPELVKTLKKRSDVKYAEPNYRIRATSVSDDMYSDYQWSMQNRETSPNVSYEWNTKGVTGSEKIVAVVDSGVDYTHPDLKDNMWHNTHYPTLKGEYGYDFVRGDDDPMDENGHGTHCAGIIGAAANNGEGISGVNQKIRIMALRILDEDGSSFMGHEIAAYNYIEKALDLGEPVVAINNSWGNGEYSTIFAELIDVVGEKGAITVVSAGNEGMDLDKEYYYPVAIDSQYLISVAATTSEGKLVNFSNYGKETVDVAAPGVDILSSVSYGCYNPTIYGDKQSDYSAGFNDYETEGGWESADELSDSIYLNGKPYDSEDGRISVTSCEDGFDPSGVGKKERTLIVDAKDIKAEDLICMTVPYEISETTEEAPFFSVMTKALGSSDQCGLFGFIDVPQGTDLDIDTIGEMYLSRGYYIGKNDFDNWNHAWLRTLDEEELKDAKKQAAKRKETDLDPLKREIVILVYAYADCSLKVELDDMGISVADPEGGEEWFGKYDFYSGTSMAAPYVSGAVAIKAAELGDDISPQTLVNETVSMAREDDLPVIDGRSLDFRKRPDELSPRIGKISVDQKEETLTIDGSGLAPSTGTEVWIGDSDDGMEKAEIISKEDSRVVVRNNNYINNIKTVRVKGYNDKSSVCRDVYLVRGKNELTDRTDSIYADVSKMTTDGKLIYWVDGDSDSIMCMDPEKADEGQDYYAGPDPKEIFDIKESKTAEYMMEYDSDLVYMNGSLYAVLEYGMSDESEVATEDPFWGKDVTWGGGSIYSSEFRLVRMTKKKDDAEVISLGKLPEELEKTADRTMAAYNGKLYFMGGYSYNASERGISDKVWVYDPSSKKWSEGPSMPEGRAGGKALQSGSELIYTMGYSDEQTGQDPIEQHYPANLVFDGKKWRKSSVADEKSIEPLVIDKTLKRSGTSYIGSGANVSLVKGGLLYTGLPVMNYGDIFSYKTSEDSFADSGYNYAMDIADNEISGIAVGDTFYGFEGSRMYRFKVSSGLVNVTSAKTSHGKVKGTGSFMPGNTASVNVKADSGYRIKSLKVNGKTVSIKNNQTSYTLTLKNLTKDQKVSAAFEKKNFKVTVKKQGKGKVTGAGSYLKGKTANIKITASKGWYIKSVKIGSKSVRLKKYAKSRTLKIKKDAAVKVVFKKRTA